MDELLQQLMQMQAPPTSLGGNFSSQQNSQQQTLGQMFSDPNMLRHQPLPQTPPQLPSTLQKMPQGFSQTYAGQKQAESQLDKFKIDPKDETALQAQGQRTMQAIQRMQR